MNWRTICRSKKDGGLGVLDLENLNIALLAKWWWKLLADQSNIWRPIIRGRYYHRRKPLKEGYSFRPGSYWWRGVLKTREAFKCGTSYALGDGTQVEWWNDIWYGHTPLRTVYPTLYDKAHNKNRTVTDCWGIRGWKWRSILAGVNPVSTAETDMIARLKEDLKGCSTGEGNDQIRWRWNTSGEFSVKSTYRFLQDSGVADRRFVAIWKIRTPLKVKIFVWLMLRRRVLTADNLRKRGWSGEGRCPLCADELESGTHLFLTCHFAKDIISGLLADRSTLQTCTTPHYLWELHAERRSSLGRRELSTLATTWWVLWLERNQRIFESKKHTKMQLTAEIRSLRDRWSKYCAP